MGGLGNAGNSFIDGYNQVQDRKAALEEREFMKGQRQRKLDEQGREDTLRKDLQGIGNTETIEVDNPNYVENPVLKDDDGNDMPAAPDVAKTVSTTRERSQDAIFRDYAKAYQKQGDIAKAAELNEKADKYGFQRSGRMAQELIASSSGTNVTLADMAKRAGEIFQNDPFGGGIKGVQENADGTVTVKMFNKDTQKEVERVFGSKTQLSESLQAYYSPEMYAKIQEARIKAQENAMDPSKRYMRVGNSVYDTATQTFKEGPVPPGFVYDGEGADGQPRYVRGGSGGGGSGTGAGKAGKGDGNDIGSATKLLTEFLGKSDGSPEGAARQARAVSLLDPLYQANPGMSPRTAAAIAADAAADPTKVTMQLDKNTGLIGKVYRNPDFEGGRQFNLAPGSATPEEMEKVVGKSGMTGVATDLVDSMIGALPKEQQAAARGQLVAVAADPVQRKAYLAAAQEAGKDVTALTRQLDLIGRYVAPPAPAGERKIPAVGGLTQKTDPNSPAGRAQARQAQLKADADAKEQQKLEASQALGKQFQADKKTMGALELAQKYQDSRFQLPTTDAAELQRIERTIR